MKKKKDEHPFGDSGQLILFIIFLIVWIGDSFFLRKTTFLSNYMSLYIRLMILGIMLITSIYLIKSGHIAIDSNRLLEKRGFRYVRHPLYLGCILIYLGMTIATLSIISFVLFLVISAFYNYIASYEEKLLDVKFGDEYRQYRKRTGKWIPRMLKANKLKKGNVL